MYLLPQAAGLLGLLLPYCEIHILHNAEGSPVAGDQTYFENHGPDFLEIIYLLPLLFRLPLWTSTTHLCPKCTVLLGIAGFGVLLENHDKASPFWELQDCCQS